MTNVSEKWTPIYGYENYFEASNFGRLRSLITGKILKTSLCRKGYENIRLYVKDVSFKSHKVHRLVLSSFSDIKNAPQVNHINGIKNDNRLENLEWSNNSHNIKHAWATGLFKPKLPKSLDCVKSKYFIHKEYGIYKNINELASEFNITRHNVTKNNLVKIKYIQV
jgi:hypothetical protein